MADTTSDAHLGNVNISTMRTVPSFTPQRHPLHQGAVSTDPFPQSFADELPSNYGYPGFEDSMNWIPISVFPSPYEAELEQDFAFFLPPLSPGPGFPAAEFGPSAALSESHDQYRVHSHVDQYQDLGRQSASFSTGGIGLEQSPGSSNSDPLLMNKSVTGSSGSLESRRKRRKSSYVPNAFQGIRTDKSAYGFPPGCETDLIQEETSSLEDLCPQGIYDFILMTFRGLCTSDSVSSRFDTPSFPNRVNINWCIHSYFLHFHQILPLIHKPSITNNKNWILLLAVATIGSTFCQKPWSNDLRDAFQEFLRRALHRSEEGLPGSGLDPALIQARILNVIGLTTSDRDQLRGLAPKYHADFSRWCLQSGILQTHDTSKSVASTHVEGNELEQQWLRWIGIEGLRRIGYIGWLLDTSLGYLANSRPLCNMDDARAPLPCPESHWEAATAEEWYVATRDAATMPSLCAALESLYANKAVDTNLSDLAQMTLINALFQRTWEVGTHIKQPLSEWVPTGKALGFLNTPIKDNFWLPLYPLYANWRNSACDCLDIIQWQASAQVAKASGVEHDLVLHLHLARIVLLTPFQEIQDLLFSLIGKVEEGMKASYYVHDGSYQPRNHAKIPQIRKITWRWLNEDQHKARLAMLHAGSVFWHVRRYSSSSFYEPLAVYLASVVLWTYASYKSAALERGVQNGTSGPVGGPSGPDADLSIVQPARVERPAIHNEPSQSHQQSLGTHDVAEEDVTASESESSSDQPEFIHLDRPCDDEMVQHFVRNGHNMSGHMSNVGDICKAPEKVLLEGAKLLRTRLTCWGVSREYHDILMKLAEVRKGG